MQNTLNYQQKLASFINFHSHPHADYYNTIDGIITPFNTSEDINKIMDLLQKEYSVLPYDRETEPNEFLKKLSHYLAIGRTVFINTNTLKFNPVIYDQLQNIRAHNKFNIILNNGKDLSKTEILEEAKLFIILNKKKDINDIYEITDHVLDLRKEQS